MRHVGNHFVAWLYSLTVISRYLVVALLIHLGLVTSLTFIRFAYQPSPPQDGWLPPDPKGTIGESLGWGTDGGDAGPELPTPVDVSLPESETTEVLQGVPKPTPAQPLPEPGGLAFGPVRDVGERFAGGRTGIGGIGSPPPTSVRQTLTAGNGFGAGPGSGAGEGSMFGHRPGPSVGPDGGAPGSLGVATTLSASERAVRAALVWLQRNQRADGSWACAHSETAGTALALLAFLGNGRTPDDQEFGTTVTKGFNHLLRNLGADGLVRGGNMYAHGLVTLALAEGFAACGQPILREPLEKAVAAIVRSQGVQKTTPAHRGGWRYSPNAADADLSVSGWIIMALKTAKAVGVEIPHQTFVAAEEYVWRMHAKGGFGYSSPAPSPNMTAVGVLCLQFLGKGDDSRIREALQSLRKSQAVDWDGTGGGYVLYGWYYTTMAMFQAGGAHWQAWDRQIRSTMIQRQQEDGSWLPPALSGEAKSLGVTPVYATSLGALILEADYRYVRVRELPQPARSAGVVPQLALQR